jgi:hypothetical protein
MKKIISAFFVAIATCSFAQDLIQYKIIKNEPIEPRHSLNLEFMNMDVNTNYVDNISFNIGINGYSKITNKLNVAYQVNKSYLVLGKLLNKNFPGNLDINTGIQFFLSEKLVNRNVDVVLDSKEQTVGNTKYTTNKLLTVPATILKKFGVQGGVNLKKCAFEFNDVQELLTHTASGFYTGLVSRKITNIIISDDKYGRSFKSYGYDLFLDALILPINNFKNVATGVNETHEALPFGFRCGYKLYQIEKKEFTGKKFGVSGTASFGYRPYLGWNLSAGIGITILKH